MTEETTALETEKTTTQEATPDIVLDIGGRPIDPANPSVTATITREALQNAAETPGTEKTEEKPAEIDSIKGTYADKEIVVPLDAELDLGLEEKPTLKQITARYKEESRIRQENGKLASEKAQLDAKRQKLDADLALVSDMTSGIAKAANSRDIDAFFNAITTLTPGVDPSEMLNNVMQTLLPEAERRLSMDEEQLAAEDLKRSNEFLKRSLDSRRASLEQQTAQEKQQTQIKQIIAKSGLSETEYIQGAKELDNMAKNGQLKPDRITALKEMNPLQIAQEVVSCVQAAKVQGYVEGVIKKVAPDRVKDDKLFSTLCGIVTNPYSGYQATEQDLIDIINGQVNSSQTVSESAKTTDVADSKEVVQQTPSNGVAPNKIDPNDPSTWKPVTIQQLFDPRFNSR